MSQLPFVRGDYQHAHFVSTLHLLSQNHISAYTGQAERGSEHCQQPRVELQGAINVSNHLSLSFASFWSPEPQVEGLILFCVYLTALWGVIDTQGTARV